MSKIKFGTDGWRAIIADDYTVTNVQRVAEATAKWMRNKKMSKVVIGHDCRFGGALFAETSACVFATHDIEVILSRQFVSTPMVSLGVVKLEADMGVVITASHNPPSYNGFKLKSSFGGPTIPAEIAEIESMIPEQPQSDYMSLEEAENKGQVSWYDLEELYVTHIEEHFDMESIREKSEGIAYDAMFGAGQGAMKRLLPGASLLHCDLNPSFNGQAPEPIHRNLSELSALIKHNPGLLVGIANDGDADRIGMYDQQGEFVDSHHILLLLLLYLFKYKKMSGKVIVTFSVTDKMQQLAEQFGLEVSVTKIGFKYIAEIMIEEDVLVGGEESGGLAVKGHIPERDGIWIGLLILEFMALTGKTIRGLIEEVYDLVGPFSFDRDDLHIDPSSKEKIIASCANRPFDQIGERKVTKVEDIDGYKFYLEGDAWVMIRPSGTEPVLRIYAQAPDKEQVRDILDATHKAIKSFS